MFKMFLISIVFFTVVLFFIANENNKCTYWGENYCNNFVKVNITVLRYENNYFIGNYFKVEKDYGLIKSEYICQITHFKYFIGIGDIIEVYYRKNYPYNCVDEEFYRKYIEDKKIVSDYKFIILLLFSVFGFTSMIMIIYFQKLKNNNTFHNIESQIEIYNYIKTPNLEDICIYCLCKLSLCKYKLIALPCGHWFHDKCVNITLKNRISLKNKTFICPVCRL